MGFSCSGHAEYAGNGQDIVCAAVSSALYMAANTITDVLCITPDILRADEQSGMALRVSQGDAAACRTVLAGLKLHLIGLEEQYTEYIQVAYMEV